MWVNNGQLFLDALKQGDLAKTYIGPDLFHPGISILWISAFVNLLFGSFEMDYLIVIQRAFFTGIFVLLTFLSYKLWIKRWPKKIFFLTLIYLLCNPFSVIWGNITWLDSLLLSLTLPIILYWLEFLEKRQQSALILTGTLIGLSVLTKYIGADRFLMIILITFYYSYQSKLSIKQFISPLIKVGLIAFLTFAIFYPAFWLDPYFVLFDRYDTSRSYQTISYTHITSSGNIYLRYIKRVDLLIWFGGILTIFQIIKNNSFKFIQPALAGLTHFLILLLALLLLTDIRRGGEAFIGSIGRYQIASILLLSPIFFAWIFSLKINPKLKYFIIAIPFCIELYFAYRIQVYPWLT
jgi:4-amino-4-deoxy-L-arabinose transferase-like glycosyltransferase